jgi:hypothetical protein
MPSSLRGAGAVLLLAVLLVPPGVAGAELPTAPHAPGAGPAGGPPRPVGPTAPIALGPASARSPSAAGGFSELSVLPSDPATVPNEGLEMNLTAYAPPALPANSSFQLSAVLVVGAVEAVFGVFQSASFGPIAFYALYSNSTDVRLALEYWPDFPLAPGTGYRFALTWIQGGSWEFTVDDRPFEDNLSRADVGLNGSSATWSPGVGFTEIAEYSASPFVPPNVTATLAFAVRTSSGWYLPAPATMSSFGRIAVPWGLEGATQHPTLAPGEVSSGSGVASQPNGTVLWSTGPQPLAVALTADPPVVPALGGVQLNVSVARGGAPMPGVFVYLADRGGGVISPALVESGPLGTAHAILRAANVSANRSDSILATIVLFGFRGNASAGLLVTAPVQLLLDGPGRLLAPPFARIGLSFRVHTPAGGAVAGVMVQFGVIGAGGVEPFSTVTDTDGRTNVTVLTPGGAGSLTVVASVVAAGYWGTARVTIDVVAPGPDSPVGPPALLGALAGLLVAGALAVLLLGRRRPPRHPLPPLPQAFRRAPPPARAPDQP